MPQRQRRVRETRFRVREIWSSVSWCWGAGGLGYKQINTEGGAHLGAVWVYPFVVWVFSEGLLNCIYRAIDVGFGHARYLDGHVRVGEGILGFLRFAVQGGFFEELCGTKVRQRGGEGCLLAIVAAGLTIALECQDGIASTDMQDAGTKLLAWNHVGG
jgi:hypothetical protein